jgi:hypothetical protein
MIEKIKCVDNRGYSLTEDQEYDVIKREGNFIFVNNDKDKLARYSAEMFEALVPPPPPPPARTEADCIASITNNGSQTRYVNLSNETKIISCDFEIINALNAFSCGVKMVVGINDTMNTINNVTQTDQNIAGDDLLDLQKALFKSHLKNYMRRQNSNAGIYLVSTNLNHNEDLVTVIDEIADFQSESELNPNSDNQIKVWGFLNSSL